MPSDTYEKNAPAYERSMEKYLDDIRQFPRLTREEEQELAVKCGAGDENAIRKMVNANLRLVVAVAKEYRGRGVPFPDLVQEGSIGLITAAKKFDHTRECRFSTYATKWIRQGITRCILNHAGLIRVPQHTAEQIRKIRRARAALQGENGGVPDTAALSAECDIPEKKIKELLELVPEICSLDAPVGEDEDSTLGLLLGDERDRRPEEDMVRSELKQTVFGLLDTLPERQRRVLCLHFGMEDGEIYSLEQIGEKLGVSKERARQIEQQALKKMKEQGALVGLEDFLE